jgi:hypothetical protein
MHVQILRMGTCLFENNSGNCFASEHSATTTRSMKTLLFIPGGPPGPSNLIINYKIFSRIPTLVSSNPPKQCNALKHVSLGSSPHNFVPSRPLSLGLLGLNGPIEGPAALLGPGADVEVSCARASPVVVPVLVRMPPVLAPL